MKYLTVLDFNWEDQERLTNSWKKIIEQQERDPESLTKEIFGAHRLMANLTEKTKQNRLIAIVEADSEEQIINQLFSLAPYIDMQTIPLVDSRKVMKIIMGWKK